MEEGIREVIQALGPAVLIIWIRTILSAVLWPQKYFNSILLMVRLMVTVIFTSGFFGNNGGYFLLGCFLLVSLALFMVPILLIINGIQMIRRESLCLSNVLSLLLGIVVGIGEIATVIYVLGLADFLDIGELNYLVMLLAFTVFYFSALVLSFVIYSVFITIMPHRKNFNYIIIHGCGLKGDGTPTKLLSDRVDKAIEIYEKCREKPYVIPSGGQGVDEVISEAQSMKNYLMQHGIPEERILPEDKSTTTRENLINSKKIIDDHGGKKKTALVSSNYHIYRCLRIAKETGLHCTGIGAHTAFYYWPSALIREFMAVFLTRRFIVWALIGYLFFVGPILYILINA